MYDFFSYGTWNGPILDDPAVANHGNQSIPTANVSPITKWIPPEAPSNSVNLMNNVSMLYISTTHPPNHSASYLPRIV